MMSTCYLLCGLITRLAPFLLSSMWPHYKLGSIFAIFYVASLQVGLHFFAEQVLSFSSEAELLTIKKQLCENLKNLLKLQLKLEPDENDHLSCDTNVDSITSSIQQFGQIATKEIEILRCSIDGELESNVSKGKTVNLSLAVR